MLVRWNWPHLPRNCSSNSSTALQGSDEGRAVTLQDRSKAKRAQTKYQRTYLGPTRSLSSRFAGSCEIFNRFARQRTFLWTQVTPVPIAFRSGISVMDSYVS